MWLSKVPLLTLNVETSDKHEELLFVVWFVWLCVTVQELCDCPSFPYLTLNVEASDKHEELLFVICCVWLSKSCVIV